MLERRLASTEADLQQKLSSCQEVVYVMPLKYQVQNLVSAASLRFVVLSLSCSQ